MDVKTAELKNNLSKYLRQLQKTGETIIVCDRDQPVASLSPIQRNEDTEWQRYREEALARAKRIGLKIEISLKRPRGLSMPHIETRIAPDGHTDIQTIDLERKGRRY